MKERAMAEQKGPQEMNIREYFKRRRGVKDELKKLDKELEGIAKQWAEQILDATPQDRALRGFVQAEILGSPVDNLKDFDKYHELNRNIKPGDYGFKNDEDMQEMKQKMEKLKTALSGVLNLRFEDDGDRLQVYFSLPGSN